MEALELLPFRHMLEKMTDINGESWNTEDGVHSYIYEFGIDMPIELQVLADEEGKVQIGSTPPLYDVDTTFRPSYHTIRFTAIKFEPTYGSAE